MTPSVLLVMGVSGSGKSTLGRDLAAALGAELIDADDYHSPAAIERMRGGVPLDDESRQPWLEELHDAIVRATAGGGRAVVACSALKGAYREVLLAGLPDAVVVHLRADRETLARRLRERTGHFMPPYLLESQLETLEEPEDALVLDAGEDPGDLVERVVRELASDR